MNTSFIFFCDFCELIQFRRVLLRLSVVFNGGGRLLMTILASSQRCQQCVCYVHVNIHCNNRYFPAALERLTRLSLPFADRLHWTRGDHYHKHTESPAREEERGFVIHGEVREPRREFILFCSL